MRILMFIVVLLLLMIIGLAAEPIPKFFAQQDKLEHLLGFFAFAFTLRAAWPKLHFVGLLAVSSAVALAIELGQEFLPARTPSKDDIAAGIIGAVLGCVCSMWLQRWKAPRPAQETAGGKFDRIES